MTRHHPRPFLTREDQADEVLRINALARTGAAMVRCDGHVGGVPRLPGRR